MAQSDHGEKLDYFSPVFIMAFMMAVMTDAVFLPGILALAIPAVGIVIAAFAILGHYATGIAVGLLILPKVQHAIPKFVLLLGILLPLPTLSIGILLAVIMQNRLIEVLATQAAIAAVGAVTGGAGAVAGAVVRAGVSAERAGVATAETAQAARAGVTAAEAGEEAAVTGRAVGAEKAAVAEEEAGEVARMRVPRAPGEALPPEEEFAPEEAGAPPKEEIGEEAFGAEAVSEVKEFEEAKRKYFEELPEPERRERKEEEEPPPVMLTGNEVRLKEELL